MNVFRILKFSYQLMLLVGAVIVVAMYFTTCIFLPPKIETHKKKVTYAVKSKWEGYTSLFRQRLQMQRWRSKSIYSERNRI
jgi:hypothetical protein